MIDPLFAEAFKKFGLKEAQTILSSAGKSLKKFQFKTYEDLQLLYRDYLNRTFKKHSTIKTLLYKSEPKFLYDFYENLDISNNTVKHIPTIDSNKIFTQSKHIIISGTGGIGKSMMMKHILVDQCYTNSSIPIFFELKQLNDLENTGKKFEEVLLDEVYSQGLKFSLEQFIYTLEKGRYTVILDGFDEINTEIVQHATILIKRFTDKYHLNNVVISSRPSDQFIGWETFTQFNVDPLSKQQAISLVKKINFDKNVTTRFLRELKNSLYEDNESFASIPLLLTMMLLTYESNGIIPNNLTEFYNQAFYTLYQRHDASKSGYKRQLKSKISVEEFKNILGYVGMKTFFTQNIEFSEEEIISFVNKYSDDHSLTVSGTNFIHDVIHSVCLFIQDGTKIKFSHRSFQEFFAAFYVTKLPDNIQKKLLLSWSQSESSILMFNKNFVNALFHLQKDRTIHNLIIPIFDNVIQAKNELSREEFIKYIFSEFIFAKETDTDLVAISFHLSIIGGTFLHCHIMLFRLLNINFRQDIDDFEKSKLDSKELFSVLSSKLGEEFSHNIRPTVTISKMWNQGEEIRKTLIEYLNDWLFPRIDYLIEWKNNYHSENSTKWKRTYKSVVEDL